jgi:hypothetical protein
LAFVLEVQAIVRLLEFRLKSLFKELTVIFGILACAIFLRCYWLSVRLRDLTHERPVWTWSWYDMLSTWRLGLIFFCIFAISFAFSGWARHLKRVVPLLKKLAVGAVVLSATLCIFLLEENIRGRIELHSYMRQLRARGEKLTLAEMSLPRPSTDQNALSALLALTNQFNALRKECPFPIDATITRPRVVASGHAIVRSERPNLGVNRIPVSYETSAPSRVYGRRMGRGEGEEETNTTFQAPVKADWTDLDGQIVKASNLLKEAQTLLSGHSLNMELDYTHGSNIRLPCLEVTRAIANWLALTALSEIHTRNLNAAAEDIVSIAELTHFGQEELLINFQIGRWQAGLTGLGVTWEALQRTGWTDDQLLALQRAWQEGSVIQSTVPALELERTLYRNYFKQARHFPAWREFRSGLFYDSRGGFPPSDLDELLSDLRDGANAVAWRLAWSDQDELRFLQQYELMLDQARRVVGRQNWSAFALSEGDFAPARGFYDSWRFLLSPGVTANIGFGMRHAFEYETQREMTVAAIAIKRYELRTGGLPPDLSALVPEYLSELPHDWMSGKPLRYHTNPDGTFTLYSVGTNGIDDGGDPSPVVGRLAFSIWNECDAVWPMPASAADIDGISARWYF